MRMMLNPAWPVLVTPEEIQSAVARYAPAITQFTNGYSLLQERLAPGARVLEIGCGPGDLALWIARRGAHVVTFDQDLDRAAILKKIRPGENLSLELLDGKLGSLDLPAGHFDVIVGQAWLHHLTDDFPAYSAQLSQALKPGGCCLFLNEPLSHNPLFEVLRAIRLTQAQWIDESALYLKSLAEFGRAFSEVRVYTHHLLSFLVKLVSKDAGGWKLGLERAEQKLIRRWPQWAKYCANINVMFVRES